MKKLFKQIFRFLIVGGTATIIDWGIYYILYNYLSIDPLVANILSFVVSVTYCYIASIKWVYDVDKNKNKVKIFIGFIILSIIGLIISELLLWIGINKLDINAMLTKVVATGIVMVFNFITRKLFLE